LLTNSVVDTSGKFTASVLAFNVNLGKDVTVGAVDTSGQVAASIIYTGGAL
jgi:hypothetical protein